MQTERLIVFLKAPQPGAVKTRLAESVGAAVACDAYRALVGTLLEGIASLDAVELRFAPDNAAQEIQPWQRAGWSVAPQGHGDLGARLQRAFAEAFRHGGQRVVIIGSDCPEVSVQDVRAAWRALRSNDVVLGPAADGGYWLVGLREPQPSLFATIPWSTEKVLPETLERARAAGLDLALLRELSDVDTVADWNRFLARAPRKVLPSAEE